VIPTSNQDGRQAKNRKWGDEILIVHCCFSVSQNDFHQYRLGRDQNEKYFTLKIKQFSIFSWSFMINFTDLLLHN
jgi:hypothetical protein